MRIESFARRARAGLVVGLGALTLLVSSPAPAVAALGVDDFPYRGTVGLRDPWGFTTGYCTSFVAWRLSQAGYHFQGASLRGPNGQSRLFGNGGSWDSAAAAVGFAVDTHPAPGAVAVWHGNERGAWPTGHVGYVMAVDAAGRALIEEYNWGVRFRYGQRWVAAPRYIHFKLGASVTAKPPAPFSREYRVTATVRQRQGPGTNYAWVGLIPLHSTIRVTCQTRSTSSVNGSHIWDHLVDGTYVTDYYTTTPGYDTFSPGLPRC